LSVALLKGSKEEKEEFLAKADWPVETWSQVFGIYNRLADSVLMVEMSYHV
jgi:hypothetical protein